jgi:hypothetical protein
MYFRSEIMENNSGIEASDMLAEALKQLDNVLASM